MWSLLCIIGAALGGLAACKNDASDRYAYHVARAQGIFGSNQRITVTAAPGRVTPCEASDDSQPSACVRAGSPFPRVRIANGDIERKETLLQLSNVASDIVWDVYLEPLLDDEAQDQRCVRDELGPPPDTSTRLSDEEGRSLMLDLPACASMVLVGKPADQRRTYRVAVLGGISMRESELRQFLDRLAARTPAIDFVYVLGDVRIRNQQDSIAAFEDIMQSVSLPWSAVITPEHVRRGYHAIADHVGILDYHTRIYGMPLVVVDTASARISDVQRKALDTIRRCPDSGCSPAAALMSIPPVSLHSFEVGTFRSQQVAQELLNTLRGLGLQSLLSAIEKSSSETHFSGIRLFDVGTDQNTSDFLELTFRPRSERATLCDGWLSLSSNSRWTVSEPYMQCSETESCRGGICVPTCESDAECEGDLRCDPDGMCREACAEDVCTHGYCEADGFCDEAPRLFVRERSL